MKRALVFACLLGGCIDTGSESISIPLSLAGTQIDAPITARRGIPVVLERADLAFGPLTLCAGFQAGDNCESALAEWSSAAVLDLLNPSPVAVGELQGISGRARSYMYDFGYVSRLTTTEPLALPASETLGGASYIVEGVATLAGDAIPFSSTAVFTQDESVERGIPIVRSTNVEFSLGLETTSPPATLRFDPTVWVEDIDFGVLVQNESCEAGVDLVCDGQVQQRCDDEGMLTESIDCRSMSQVCQPDVGCVDRIPLSPQGQGAAAIRNAIITLMRPTVE